MAFSTRQRLGWAAWVLPALLCRSTVAAVPAVPISYCASVNTAETDASHSIYQSDGLCRDTCKDQAYSLAIIKGDSCWCSNKLPGIQAQVNLSKCSDPCPGFPSDLCGGNGVYGYMQIESVPGSAPTSSTVITGNGLESKTTSAPPSSSSSSSSTSASTSGTPGTTPAPVPTVQTVTADGTVKTVTVTPTAGSTSPNQASITSQSSGLSVGAAVGVAVGVIAVVLAAAIAAFCVWRRRRRQREEDGVVFQTPSPRGSSAGMMNAPKMVETGNSPPHLSRNPTDNTWESDNSGRRRSMLMPLDPRIDPSHGGMYNRNENKSHDSVNTLRDDQDYSRRVHQPKVLRATNPDPED